MHTLLLCTTSLLSTMQSPVPVPDPKCLSAPHPGSSLSFPEAHVGNGSDCRYLGYAAMDSINLNDRAPATLRVKKETYNKHNDTTVFPTHEEREIASDM
ncbi:uncharacterized protein EV422DRAFT_514109 [Fimicolochytrium jonesii]|uniref:uncharacterized protein n=1 Tax=Fimicolochytrium jonesii TaxID=1396493 RepID=UPI0022FE6AA5|nr:uncharacterized protein EV422DRAFT_514109 [Fimicolochytrium jonesii]KAI8825780.1 hypothetical protein EV422DRAFT_514109 [Fimicolochytrium jonesii]